MVWLLHHAVPWVKQAVRHPSIYYITRLKEVKNQRFQSNNKINACKSNNNEFRGFSVLTKKTNYTEKILEKFLFLFKWQFKGNLAFLPLFLLTSRNKSRAFCQSTNAFIAENELLTTLEPDSKNRKIIEYLLKKDNEKKIPLSLLVKILLPFRCLYLTILLIPAASLLGCWYIIDFFLKCNFLKNTQKNFGFIKLSFQVAETIFFELFWRYLYFYSTLAGPTAIKLLQWTATRYELFPPKFCDKFSYFFCSSYPHAFPYTVLMLNKALGESWDKFLWLNPKQIGTGSVAQVYYGVYNGKNYQLLDNKIEAYETETKPIPVAVKVVHPNCEREILNDLTVIRYLAEFLERTIPKTKWISIIESSVQFANLMFSQVNLKLEAKNMEIFRRNFTSKSSVQHFKRLACRIIVPKVFHELCSNSILVESFEKGLTLGMWIKQTDVENGKEMTKQDCLAYLHKQTSVSDNDVDFFQKHNINFRLSKKSLHAYYLNIYRTVRDYAHATFRVKLYKIKKLVFSRRSFHAREKQYYPYHLSKKDFGTFKDWERVARVGLLMYLQMLFIDNCVHADLHPGNILIRYSSQLKKKNVKNEGSVLEEKEKNLLSNFLVQAQNILSKTSFDSNEQSDNLPDLFSGEFSDVPCELVLLDFGLTTRLKMKDFINLTDVLRFLCLGQPYDGARLMVERNKAQMHVDADNFCLQFQAIFQKFHENSSGQVRLENIAIGKTLQEILMLACKHKVQLDPAFVSICISSMILEGIARKMYPGINLFETTLLFVKNVVADATSPIFSFEQK